MSIPPNSGQSVSDKPVFSLGGLNTASKNENASASKPLFGSTTSGTSNSFGGLGTTGQSGTTSPFSSGAGQNAPSSGWTFGAAKVDENKPANPPSFGNFSTPSKPISGTGQPQTFNLFGNAGGSSNNTTSATPGTATPIMSKPPSLFPNVSTTPAGPPPAASGGLFNLAAAGKSGPSLFGVPSTGETASSTSNTAGSTSNLFGAPQQQSTATSQSTNTGLFGPAVPKPAGSNLFGAPAAQSQPSTLFGKPTENKASELAKPSPFSMPSLSGQNVAGNNTASTTTPAETSKSTEAASVKSPFGMPSASNQGNLSFSQSTSTSSAPSLFSNTSSTPAPSTNLFPSFGQKNATSNPPAGQTPNLFAPQNAKKDAPASTPAVTGLFGNLGEKRDNAAAAAAPTSSPFAGPGQKKDVPDSNANPPNTTTTTNTTAAPSSSTASAPSSLFNATAKLAGTGPSLFGNPTTAIDTASGTNQTTAPAPAAGSSALGASTAGPAPSAQSRLKNKSMDEIITRWAADLSKYQKEFQVQADKVASWDRMLLENGNAISKLYSKTFQAERDTAEVQKQLSAVEGNQEELATWLDKYEKEVDEMMARQVGQGEGLQGPDQERERTYKIAERVSDRLTEMGKELTTIIEEINEASTAISKTTKADDPLSQIVRVLNGHLSQLQVIDQSTSALQAKVNAARKEGQRLGSRSQGVLGNDAADDFYRSYMSRG